MGPQPGFESSDLHKVILSGIPQMGFAVPLVSDLMRRLTCCSFATLGRFSVQPPFHQPYPRLLQELLGLKKSQ